jgi:hypothetical protein
MRKQIRNRLRSEDVKSYGQAVNQVSLCGHGPQTLGKTLYRSCFSKGRMMREKTSKLRVLVPEDELIGILNIGYVG